MEQTNYEAQKRLIEKFGDPTKPYRFQDFKQIAQRMIESNRSKGYELPDGEITRHQAIRADALSGGAFDGIKKNPFFHEIRSLFSFDKPVFTKGRLIHTAVIEPDKLEEEYIQEFTSKLDPRSTEFQTAKAQFAEISKGKIVVKRAEWENAEAISLVVNVAYFPIMSRVLREKCYIWTDENGIRHKAFPDFYDPHTKTLWDLKTVGGSLSEFDLRKSITNYGATMQLAHYARVMENIGLPVNNCRLLFVQQNDGHDVADYEIPQAIIETHKQEIKEIAEKLHFFREDMKITYGANEMWPFNYEIDGSKK